MVFSVAGQGPFPERDTSASSFFPEKPSVRLVGGALHVDKAVLFARAKSAAGAEPNDDGLLLRLIAAIRAFLARLCRAVLPSKFFSSQVSDNSRQGPNFAAGRDADAGESSPPRLSETDEEIVVDGLPAMSLDRVRQTIDEMISVAVGDTLPNSIKSALAMPDLGRRQAFRVLLQQNLGDTKQMREVRDDLRSGVERVIGPFSETYGMDKEAALALFRADLETGGGAIANRVDPNSEIRAHVFELKRLESALAALAKARGIICTRAMDSGSHVREELAGVIAEYGVDTDFLLKAESTAGTSPDAQATANDFQAANVVSMSSFRRKASGDNEFVPPDYLPQAEPRASNAVQAAVAVLVEQGVLDGVGADKLGQAAAMDSALSDESEFDAGFETETHGDDLSSFTKKDKVTKATPKP
jgi:hypothetical protein